MTPTKKYMSKKDNNKLRQKYKYDEASQKITPTEDMSMSKGQKKSQKIKQRKLRRAAREHHQRLMDSREARESYVQSLGGMDSQHVLVHLDGLFPSPHHNVLREKMLCSWSIVTPEGSIWRPCSPAKSWPPATWAFVRAQPLVPVVLYYGL